MFPRHLSEQLKEWSRHYLRQRITVRDIKIWDLDMLGLRCLINIQDVARYARVESVKAKGKTLRVIQMHLRSSVDGITQVVILDREV